MSEIFIRTNLANISRVRIGNTLLPFRVADGGVYVDAPLGSGGDICIEGGGKPGDWIAPLIKCDRHELEPQLVCERCEHRETDTRIECVLAEIDKWNQYPNASAGHGSATIKVIEAILRGGK